MLKEQYNPKRALLAKLRGDYLHAGEEEAIELIFNDIKRILWNETKINISDKKKMVNTLSLEKMANQAKSELQILDLGCGLGATAEYFHKKGLGKITGIDIDVKAIEYARKSYPNNQFLTGDATNLENDYPQLQYDIIYIINAFYAFDNQKKTLKALDKVAKPGTILAIFDYSHIDINKTHGLKDLAGKPMHPIKIKDLKSWLKEANWEIVEIKDLTPEFKRWYKSLLNKLELQKNTLITEYSQEVFDNVFDTFTSITKLFDENILGGHVVYAKFLGPLDKQESN